MNDKEILNLINNHIVLHDLITHLHDFKISVEYKLDSYGTNIWLDDYKYWRKQFITVDKLIKFVEQSSKLKFTEHDNK